MAAPTAPYIGRYINLDRSPDRRRQMEEQLGALGLAHLYTRFAGVEGASLPPMAGAETPGELGCYRSHLDVIREAAPTGAWLHVLEDDALLSRHSAIALGAVATSPDFARYDIVFTNIRADVSVEVAAWLRAMFDQNVHTDPGGAVSHLASITAMALGVIDFTFATSYLVNPTALDRVARLLAEPLERGDFMPVDERFSQLSRSGQLSMACTIPYLTAPRWEAASQIRPAGHRPSLPRRLFEQALYVGRDAAALRDRVAAIEAAKAPSVTAALIADAYRLMLAEDGGA